MVDPEQLTDSTAAMSSKTDTVVNEPTEDAVEAVDAERERAEGVAEVDDVTLELAARVEEPLPEGFWTELLDAAAPVLPADEWTVVAPELLEDVDDVLWIKVLVELRTLEDALAELLADEDRALPAQVPKADWQPVLQWSFVLPHYQYGQRYRVFTKN
ncbi:hypothetical protein DPSP01_010551 [Paraphaeosphaeria sporulosa]